MAKLAFDTGGTFTDFALLDDDENLHLHKVLSTPDNPARAVVQGVSELLEKFKTHITADELQILGATTVVTNAVLERKGARAAFITTDRFQDMLRIRDEGRYDIYDLGIQYPEPLVDKAHSFGVIERISAKGDIITPLDEERARELARSLQKQGVQSVAICLLHAYKYPRHEQLLAEIFSQIAPEISLSLSSAVCPEMREFERASTTLVNAYTRPKMREHVTHLAQEFDKLAIKRPPLWMTSAGGLLSSDNVAKFPVKLIESGPAAGAVAAAEFGRLAGESSILSFDMGGTTAKLCLIPKGEPTVGTNLEVAHHQRFRKGSGFPLKIHSIQMIEIGAGGGSIARKNPLGLLDVGPQSAGAMPGPAAYQRGGVEPTVTDADIVLGFMGTGSFVGGTFEVSYQAAFDAVKRLADDLGVTVERCAWGIHDLVNESMAKAASIHATDLGLDPRSLPLVAFGGAGPVHAYGIAKKLGIKRLIYPTGAGVSSAIGLLIAPVAADLSLSHPMALGTWDETQVKQLLDDLANQAAAIVANAGLDPDCCHNRYSVDMRHVGQGHEITVNLPDLKLPQDAFLKQLEQRFFSLYQDLFGRTVQAPLEVITWRLRASGEKGKILRPIKTSSGEALKGTRRVYFAETGFVEAPIYDHYHLPLNQAFEGPAIIEQRESTAIIGPDTFAKKDEYGHLIVDIHE